jgi:hypothetical protein
MQRALNAFACAGFARRTGVRHLEKRFELGDRAQWSRSLLATREQIAWHHLLVSDAAL